MPGKYYTASFKDIAVTAVQDLFEITAPSGAAVIIHGWSVSQKSEVADAAEEGLTLVTNRGVGSTTSGNGTSVTPQPTDDDTAAAAATVERNGTTVMAAGSGSIEELEVHAWNIRAPFIMFYPPELRPKIKASARWTLELETAPADSITMSGTVWFEE
jgi:hypothetical protein